jgi:polyphosphate kinase
LWSAPDVRAPPADVYAFHGFLGLADTRQLAEMDRADLKAPRLEPVVQRRLAPFDRQAPDLFRVLEEGDVLVHPPYDSFAASVETFMGQASVDPGVVAIKQTLYRPAPDDPVVRSLIRRAGACALRTGVTGLSENIRVVAPIGRRPEGSRLFAFGHGADRSWYLSSGDLAVRHLDRQVDVAVPGESPSLQSRLHTTLQILLALPAWELRPDGVWERGAAGAEAALRRLAADPAAFPGGG